MGLKFNPFTSNFDYTGSSGGGSGDVSGPSSSVDNTVVRFNGTTGKLIQGSGVVLDDADNLTVGKLLKINADSGNPEFDFTESGTTRAKTYYDVTNNRLTFQNNENNNADALYFADHATFTGNIVVDGTVDGVDIATADAANVKLTGDQTVAGVKTFGSFPVTPSSSPSTDYQVVNKKYVDDNTVYVGGDIMSGSLGMDGNTIYGLAEPTSDDHAATKKYVDDNSGGSGDMLLAAAQTNTGVKTFNAGTFWDKGSEVFNVKGFGAVGDDSTDDTAAIQSAIAAAGAAGGGVVYFPNGTYKIQTNPLKFYSGTTTYNGVVLVGQSATGAIVKQYSTGVDIVQGLNDDSDDMQLLNAGIERMTLHFGGTSTNSGNGVYLKAGEADSPSFQQFHMKDVIIQDCAGSGKYGFNAESIIVAYLDNVLVQDGANGFYLNGGANSSGFSSVNTSTVLRACYANGMSGIGYHIKNSTYVHLDNCACDYESGTADGYFINENANVVMTACGMENGGTYSGIGFHIADSNQVVLDGCFGFGNTNVLASVTDSTGVVINAFRNESDDSSSTTGLSIGAGSEVWDTGSDWSGADTPVSVNATGIYHTPGVLRRSAITSSATPSINCGAVDVFEITALATNITSITVTGTPVAGQLLRINITGTAARTLTFGSSFEASGTVALPTAASTAKLSTVFEYNSATSKWRCMGVA